MLKIFAIVFLLAWCDLQAQTALLSVYWRRHSSIMASSNDRAHVNGLVYLVASDASAKFDAVPGQLRAVLVLPKVGENNVESTMLAVRLMGQNELIAREHFEVSLTPEQEKRVDAYLFSRNGELPRGARFEPMIELRGFTLNKEPVVAAVTLPTNIELTLDSKATAFDEDAVVFRGIYIPPPFYAYIDKVGNWSVKGLDLLEKCQVAFAKKSDTLTFHFLNRLKFAEKLRELGTADESMEFVLKSPEEEDRNLPGVRSYLMEKQNRLPPGVPRTPPNLTVRRPQRLVYAGQSFRFRAAAPPSNREWPIYIGGSYVHSANGAGKAKDVANLEFNLNADQDLWQPLQHLYFGSGISLAPSFAARMNTSGVINDENSLRIQVPIRKDWRPQACCWGPEKDQFHLYGLRRVSFSAGYLGEATRLTQKRTNGGAAETRLFFSRTGKDKAIFKMMPFAGFELGKYRELKKNTFVQAGEEEATKNKETLLLESRGSFSRLHGGVHSTIDFSSKTSVNINYDIWRLLKAESYYPDTSDSVAGAFTPYDLTIWPSQYHRVDSAYDLIAIGRLEKGTRRYLELTFNVEISKYFDVKASFVRGELAPAFQFVNKVSAGLAFKFAGGKSIQ